MWITLLKISPQLLGNTNILPYLYYIRMRDMKLELTPEQVQVVEIALNEMFNSDSWTWSVDSNDVDRIADRAEYILKMIDKLKSK
jgi:hypothetical protein